MVKCILRLILSIPFRIQEIEKEKENIVRISFFQFLLGFKKC